MIRRENPPVHMGHLHAPLAICPDARRQSVSLVRLDEQLTFLVNLRTVAGIRLLVLAVVQGNDARFAPHAKRGAHSRKDSVCSSMEM